ncbi:ImmA/IrrE family metallo-endopeptidase [Rhodanobacter ginsengisoli]|uniref:ImmA/IrrE family metallo-endopeptidase n=1 Tax=Rhodanobacter ginsengisoli TaxID=418646 RepID=A0ABW0QR54_9GAMM
MNKLHLDRVRLQNPYAHAEQIHREEVRQPLRRRPRPLSTSDRAVAAAVAQVHRQLWHRRREFWGDQVPADAVKLLNVGHALKLHGYQLSYVADVGQHAGRGNDLEVAGVIDRDRREVRISPTLPEAVQRFTAGHELAHAVLHPHAGGIHRDRPIEGSARSSDPQERAADRFSAFFLVPEKLLAARFLAVFHTEVFELNDLTRMALGPAAEPFQGKRVPRWILARTLAGLGRYNGEVFPPLATQFGVSISTMAIRLEELGFVAG